MRFLVFSDSHLGANRYNLAWFKDNLRNVFSQVIDKSFDFDVDAILFCGDMFDTPFVSAKEINFTISTLKKLDSRPFIAIIGNHDLQSGRPLEESPVQIINQSLSNFTLLHFEQPFIYINDVKIHGVPYLTPKDFENKQAIFDIYQKNVDDTTLNIGLLHQDLSELDYSKYIPFTLSESDIQCFDFCFIGHYHNRVEKDSYLYVGSTYPLSFKQALQEKGYYIVDISSDGIKYSFYPIQSRYNLYEIALSLDEFETFIANESHISELVERNLNVIRLVISCDESELNKATFLAKEFRQRYQKDFEKIVVDYNIQSQNISVDDVDSDHEFDILSESVVNYLSKSTQLEKQKILELLHMLLDFEPHYKSESKMVQEAMTFIQNKLGLKHE